MSFRNGNATTGRQPTVGYYLALAAALVGLVCLAIAVEGTRRAAGGGDGLSALSGAGVPGLMAAWALAFYARLAFSDRLSPASQALVHASLRILMVAEIVAALFASWYVLAGDAAPAELRGIVIFADLLQVGTVLWVARFSRQ